MSVASRVLLGWLIPQPGESGAALVRRTTVRLTISLSIANLVGAFATFAFGNLVLPFPKIDDPDQARLLSLIGLGAYMAVGIPFGTWWILRRSRSARDWLLSDRSPTDEERRFALRAPHRIVFVHIVLWGVAAVAFGALNAVVGSAELGQRVAMTIALGGVITCAIVFLVSERQMRPIAARALADGVGDRRLGPGIKTRAFIAWAVGTGVPAAGLALAALSTLTEEDFKRDELAVTVLVLAALALVVALAVSMLSARAVSDPIVSVRKALERVEEGDLDVEVPVYDGSEIGQLQAGFNRMVEGLRERERIQDLFGRHVGEDVARAALEREVELGGETREVAVLFVDIVGSTQLASQRPATEVVDVLNRFFGTVVEVVREHGGWVNKFEGDAALAVFGAPVPLDDHAGQALAAARELHKRLRGVEEVEAGIGVSAGEVVAGNIGEEQRFEYTVIGDPVNEAARLTELAKERGGVLASAAALERAAPEESERWRLDGSVALRGRGEETRLVVPA